MHSLTRAEVEARLLTWMRRAPAQHDAARFETLALALFRVQFEHCAPYRRFAEARGATPARVQSWREIPAVPTGAFKEFALRGFAAADTVKTFRSSGTSFGPRGALHLDTLALYEAAACACFARGMLPEFAADARVRLLVLVPSAEAAPDSSLSHMFEVVRRTRGTPGSAFFVARSAQGEDVLRVSALRAALEATCVDEGGAPTLLCGTAFAFVHALDAFRARGLRFRLPPSARLMETGGFKGRAREIAQPELYARLADTFGVPPARIVNQYGMTELGSQFYDDVLSPAHATADANVGARADADAPARCKRVPPWVRVRVLDPTTGADCAPGVPGLLQIHDLANTGSVAALLTADFGRMWGAPDATACAFEVLGRAPGAEQRGCSIAADAMLDAGA